MVSMEVIVTSYCSKLLFLTYLGELQPTYIRVPIHLVSTMDIPSILSPIIMDMEKIP